MKLSCRFGIHNWGKWSEPYPIYLAFVQQTRCTDCNKALVTSKWDSDAPPKEIQCPKS